MNTTDIEALQSNSDDSTEDNKASSETSTYERITNAALVLFVEKGLSVPTSAITKKAGVSEGLLFHYFATKESLILELHAKILDGFYRANYRHELLKAGGRESVEKVMRGQVEDSWNWCMSNWDKVQYMELVRGAAIANQVLSGANAQIKQQFDLALCFMDTMRKLVSLRDLPNELLLDIMSNNIILVSHYMHDHPELRDSPEFREAAWKHYWASLTTKD